MEQSSLFDSPKSEPLDSRMRPVNLEEFVAQKHLIGDGKILRTLLARDNV